MYKFLIFIGIVVFLSLKYYQPIVFSIYFFNQYRVYFLSGFFFISILYRALKKRGLYGHPLLDIVLTQQHPDFKDSKGFSKNQKRNVSAATKKIVASNQKWMCGMCKNTLDYTYEVDHHIPLFKGGSNNIDNLVALCRNCHGKKTILEKVVG